MPTEHVHSLRRPMRVLIVDDDENDILLIQRALERTSWEFDVHAESSGDHALAYLTQGQGSIESPDVVLLDLNMPGRNGHETLTEIRNHPILESLPVVIFTTSDQATDMTLAFHNRAQCFVTKPTTLEEYSQLVENVLRFWNEQHGTHSAD